MSGIWTGAVTRALMLTAVSAVVGLAGGCTSWSTVRAKANTMPASEAWDYVQDEVQTNAVSGALKRAFGVDDALRDLGFDEFTNDEIKTAATASAREMGSGLSDDSTRALAKKIQAEILPLFKPTPEISKWALAIQEFEQDADPSEGNFQLPVKRLNRLLTSAMQNDPAWQDRVVIQAMTREEARKTLEGEMGGLPPPATVRWDPRAVLVLNGSWSAFVSDGKPGESQFAKRLRIATASTATMVAQRRFLWAKDFDIDFVYHPTLRWISLEQDDKLRQQYERSQSKSN